MPKVLVSVKDRVGSENVVRVLKHAGSAAGKIVDLGDVISNVRDDGSLLVYDAPTSELSDLYN